MEELDLETAKDLYIRNGNLNWFIALYDEYRKLTDKPTFVDFMAWLRPSEE